MAATLIVHPLPPDRTNGRMTTGARIELPSGDAHDLWYSFGEEHAHMLSDVHDYLAVATVFLGMACADVVRIRGTVSRSLLANLAEFVQVWRTWLPGIYHAPLIEADEPLDWRAHPQTDALAAYSGGVDATCTLYRHTTGLRDSRKRRLVGSVMVHGFDIPLSDDVAFTMAYNRARTITDSVGIPLLALQTNFKELPYLNWEFAFFAAATSAVLLLSRTIGSVLIGSCEPYNSFVYPWGSNPVSNHLLGSREVEVVTDGLELERLDKVRQLLAWPEALQGLRVCWEGSDKSSNCGVCEKCLRTRLEFLCLGLETPPCFATGVVTPTEVAGIRVRSVVHLMYLAEVLNEARRIGRGKEDWCRALAHVVHRGVRGRRPGLRGLARTIRSHIALRTRFKRVLSTISQSHAHCC